MTTPVAALDEATSSKLLKLLKPKVSQTRIGIVSTCMLKIVLLDQMDPRRLKLKTDDEADFHTHSCGYFSTLMKMHWKSNSSVKKGNHGGSYHAAHAMRHLKNNCTEEGCDSEKDSIKATQLKVKKHQEEATEIVEQNHIEKGAEAVMKKRKKAE